MKSVFFLFALVLSCHHVVQGEGGGVAVLDIDAVARQLGIEDQVRVKLASLQKRLTLDLQKTKAQLQSEIEGVQEAAGENPSENQLREIRATGQQLNSEFARLKAQAEQSLVQERVRLINEFRIKLEPIARDAAAERGLDVVLMKVTPPVFTFSSKVDITEATYKLAKEAGMQIDPSKESGIPRAEEISGPPSEAEGDSE